MTLSTADLDPAALRAAVNGAVEALASEKVAPSTELLDALRNRGVPVRLGPETVYLRVTLNFMADVEVQWGTSAVFQQDLELRPAHATRKAIAMLLARDEREVGDLMVDRVGEYQDALVVAWQMASGLDPQTAGAMLATMARRRADAFDGAIAQAWTGILNPLSSRGEPG